MGPARCGSSFLQLPDGTFEAAELRARVEELELQLSTFVRTPYFLPVGF